MIELQYETWVYYWRTWNAKNPFIFFAAPTMDKNNAAFLRLYKLFHFQCAKRCPKESKRTPLFCMPMSEKKKPRTFFVCDTLLVHFEVFDFHLSLLSTIPGAMAQISPCQPETQEDRKMLAKIQGIHANPKLTLKVVIIWIVKNMLMLLWFYPHQKLFWLYTIVYIWCLHIFSVFE